MTFSGLVNFSERLDMIIKAEIITLLVLQRILSVVDIVPPPNMPKCNCLLKGFSWKAGTRVSLSWRKKCGDSLCKYMNWQVEFLVIFEFFLNYVLRAINSACYK